jgi:membrane protein DedA with SNARE-associated domain
MPVPLFTLLTAAGSLIWNTALILAGYLLGANYHVVDQYLGIVSKVVLGLVVVAVVWFVVSRVRQRRRDEEEEEERAHSRR